MSKKISLNPIYTTIEGNSWSTATYNGLEYHISTNKSNSSVSTLQCEFTTPYDNIDIVIEIGSSSKNDYDWCYVGPLDDSGTYQYNYLDRISGKESNNKPLFKTVTINVAKAGPHFLRIGYRKSSSDDNGSYDCGYFRLVTTEVDSLKPDPYIYCGTKTTVTEEPIKFTKTNISNGSNGVRNWMDYQGTSKDYLWEANVGDDNSLKTAKISFTTSNDNVTVILKYSIRLYGGSFRVSNLDGNIKNNLMIYKGGIDIETITKEITVQKAGEHFIWIGYNEGSFSAYIYVGFSSTSTNVVTTTKTLVPKKILANNKNISGVYVGSELIWGKQKIIQHDIIRWTGKKINLGFLYDNSVNLGLSYSYTDYTKNQYGQKISGNTYLYANSDTNTYQYDLNNLYFWNNPKCKDISLKFAYTYNYKGNLYGANYIDSIDFSDINFERISYFDNFIYGWNGLENVKLPVNFTNGKKSLHKVFSGGSNSKRKDGFNNIKSLDTTNWDTSNVNYMNSVFNGCSYLTSMDVSKWDTSKVTNMGSLFFNCSYLTSLDLSEWDVSNVTDANGIFSKCSSLTTLIDGHESESNVVALNGLKTSISLYCDKLSYESIYAVFRGMATVTTSQTIYLPRVMQGKLDATKVKIATDKGWIIDYM